MKSVFTNFIGDFIDIYNKSFESSCLDVDLKKMEERKHQNGFRKKKKVRYLRVESVVTFEIGDSEEVCVKISSSAPPSKF